MSHVRNLTIIIFATLAIALAVLFSFLWQATGVGGLKADETPLYLENWSLNTLRGTKALVRLRGFLLEDAAGTALISP